MSDKIEIKYSKEKVKVILPASHFSRQKLSTIENYMDATVTLEDSGSLSLIYDKPKYSYNNSHYSHSNIKRYYQFAHIHKIIFD